MTHIRGEIEKVYEIRKDAYTQPITGGRSITPYTFAANVGAGITAYFDLTSPPFFLPNILLHSINMSSYSVIPQRIYLIKYPEGTVLGDFYFMYNSTQQFYLGDVKVNIGGANYVRVYLQNNAGGIRYFEGSLWIIEV